MPESGCVGVQPVASHDATGREPDDESVAAAGSLLRGQDGDRHVGGSPAATGPARARGCPRCLAGRRRRTGAARWTGRRCQLRLEDGQAGRPGLERRRLPAGADVADDVGAGRACEVGRVVGRPVVDDDDGGDVGGSRAERARSRRCAADSPARGRRRRRGPRGTGSAEGELAADDAGAGPALVARSAAPVAAIASPSGRRERDGGLLEVARPRVPGRGPTPGRASPSARNAPT